VTIVSYSPSLSHELSKSVEIQGTSVKHYLQSFLGGGGGENSVYLIETEKMRIRWNRSECRCEVEAGCRACVGSWTRRICWVCRVPSYWSRPRADYRCGSAAHCSPCTRHQSSQPGCCFVHESLHLYPVYTIEPTSSRHGADVEQTLSKHRANIELARPAN